METERSRNSELKSQNNEALAYIKKTYLESLQIKEQFLNDHGEDLVRVAKRMGECIRDGGKMLVCGNGGSASDAQHWAAEMVGRMLVERQPLPAVALTTDTSIITAVANDYDYESIFSKQVEALGKKEDLLFAISTSGKSPNVLKAVKVAKERGMTVIGITGKDGGELAKQADFLLCAKVGTNSSRIQETHIFALHSLVDVLDRYYL